MWKPKNWTEEEMRYLVTNAKVMKWKDIADHLGRTVSNCHETYKRYLNKENIPIKQTAWDYKGCDEDCFNCVYEDCIKPVETL